jgi:hypothetical protein
MPVDVTPSWKTGHATIRDLEAQLPSVRTVMACWEAAKNAGIEMADAILVGDGHAAGLWVAHVYGAITVGPDPAASGGVRHRYVPPDNARVRAFLRHWRRLVSRYDWHLRVIDAVSDRVLAEV